MLLYERSLKKVALRDRRKRIDVIHTYMTVVLAGKEQGAREKPEPEQSTSVPEQVQRSHASPERHTVKSMSKH
jgi:hypothetical protein